MQGVPGAATGGPTEVEPVHLGKVVTISVIAALGGFLFGYDSSVINGANQAVYHQFDIVNPALQGFSVAIALLGSAVGAFVGGQLTDKLGRKKVMVLAAVLFLIAGVGQAFPFALLDFMFWRIVGGFAIGLAAVVSPMYISELAPAHLRGRLSSLFQLAIVFGIFATQLVNQVLIAMTPKVCQPGQVIEGCAGMVDPASKVPMVQANNDLWFGLQTWQWMFLCMVFPAVLYWVLALTLPESPRFLVAKGRDDEAKEVLEQVYVNDVSAKLAAIQESLAGERKMSLRDIKGPKLGLLPLVWVGIILAILQQFVGINAVFYYSNVIWSAIGFGAEKAFMTSTIISAVNVIFTFLAIALVDRVGRKPLLLIGSLGMFATLGILTWVFVAAPQCTQALIDAGGTEGCTLASELNSPLLSSSGGWVAVAMLNLYVAFFATTWGPIVWVLLGEMFPNKIRAAAMSVAVAANWLANFAVTESFKPLIDNFGLGVAYGLFTLGALVSFFYVSKFVKETKGIQLEDMDELEGMSTT